MPLGHGEMQSQMVGALRQLIGQVRIGSGDLDDEADFVCGSRDRLQCSHDSVATVDAEEDRVVLAHLQAAECVPDAKRHALLHAAEPVVELADDDRVSDRPDDDTLVPGQLGPFKLHGIAFRRDPLTITDLDGPVRDCLIYRIGSVQHPG